MWMENFKPAIHKIWGRYIHRPYCMPGHKGIPKAKYPRFFHVYLHIFLHYSPHDLLSMFSPGFRWWKHTVDSKFYLRYKPMAIDKCDECRTYECYIQDAIDDEDDELEEERRNQFKYHMKSASFGYKANKSLVKWCEKLWRIIFKLTDDDKILPRLKIYSIKSFLAWSPIHVTIDWDKDRNELQRQFQRFYGSLKPQFISLNIKITPDTEKGL